MMGRQDRMRRNEQVAHLCDLGPRAVGELLDALTRQIGGVAVLAGLLDDFGRLSPGMVQEAGGHAFHRPRPRAVPADLMRGAA